MEKWYEISPGIFRFDIKDKEGNILYWYIDDTNDDENWFKKEINKDYS